MARGAMRASLLRFSARHGFPLPEGDVMLYLLMDTGSDEVFIVRAESSESARATVVIREHSLGVSEGRAAKWHDEARTHCVGLSPEGVRGVILAGIGGVTSLR